MVHFFRQEAGIHVRVADASSSDDGSEAGWEGQGATDVGGGEECMPSQIEPQADEHAGMR